MRNAEMLVWAGDFNYRIDATYEDAIDHIRCNDLEYLLERVRNLSTCAFSYVTSSFSCATSYPSPVSCACKDSGHCTSCSSDCVVVHEHLFVPHSDPELSSILISHAALSGPCPVTLPLCSEEQDARPAWNLPSSWSGLGWFLMFYYVN